MHGQRKNQSAGSVLVYLIVLIFIFPLVLLPIFSDIAAQIKFQHTEIDREEALQIAEAGVDYYQWHLAHFPNDYQDGTGGPGPYYHVYTDPDTGAAAGGFSLAITPPPTGSTIVTIQSTASTTAGTGITRTVTARYGIPSLAVDAFLSNDVIWIGSGENVGGQLDSNNGVRFDGTTNAPVLSAKSSYVCPTSQGSPCPATEPGIWGSAPQSVKNYWQFPVPAVDFSSITANLSTMKSSAQSAGIYLPPSNAQGYSLVFNSNGTVSIYKVTKLLSEPGGWDVNGVYQSKSTDYKTRTLLYTDPVPSNGIIYVEDTTWVEGTVNGRVMVAAAELPYNSSTAPSIYIPNNIVYTAKDGSDVLGLLAQNNVVVSYAAPQVLEIDAALIAQNGSAQCYYYWSGGIKNAITVYGAIMTYGQWTWTWVNGGSIVVSGYANTYSNYDANLLYAPPPSFPLSTSGYQQLSWTSN